MIPIECYWCGLLYFTGSDFFNKQMRIIALEHNFTLSEYYLTPLGENAAKGTPVEVNSEEDVFEYLNMSYKPPAQRNL
jgi:DNA polymerase beta